MQYSKYSILVFLLITACISCSNKPDELPSSLRIDSQDDIDKYDHLLDKLEVYEGSIVFRDDHSYDLSAFKNLKLLTGALIVGSQEQLDAFTNLKEVEEFIVSFPCNVKISNIEVINGFFLPIVPNVLMPQV